MLSINLAFDLKALYWNVSNAESKQSNPDMFIHLIIEEPLSFEM